MSDLAEDIPPVSAKPVPKFRYRTFGPIHLEKGLSLAVREESKQFWDEMDKNRHRNGIRKAVGVYIFATRNKTDSELIPWYVGKTCGGFETRFLKHHRLFEKLLSLRGHLYVFLIPHLTDEGSEYLAPKKKLDSVELLETMLIQRCLRLNHDLFNAKKVKHVKGLVVPGFTKAQGREPKPALELRAMLQGKV